MQNVSKNVIKLWQVLCALAGKVFGYLMTAVHAKVSDLLKEVIHIVRAKKGNGLGQKAYI